MKARQLPPSALMVCATLLFATMGVCVKFASAHYHSGEIVFYRAVVGVLFIGGLAWARGGTLKTRVPAMHFWRSTSGVVALSMWFYAISQLPLATAMTLNYMSSVWMALFLIGGAVMMGGRRSVDGRLVASVMVGFAGVALVLRPSLNQEQLWGGLIGVISGMLSATAYLQVTALGRTGEPGYRVVFYFSVGGLVAGALSTLWSGWSGHTWTGVLLLLATGVLATAAQILMTQAYTVGRPLTNACLQYLGIVYSFIYGVWLFDDPVTWMAVTGMLLIVGAGLSATLLRAQKAPPDSVLPATDT